MVRVTLTAHSCLGIFVTHIQPVLFSTAKIQRRIGDLRFLGYVGAQLSGILVPILLYQLTHNVALAGLALLIEWAPKLFFYLAGGSFIAHYGRRQMHLLLDVVRIGALALLLLGTLGYASVWSIAIAAALYQCANAVSNILFEVSVTRWWSEDERAHGHASMMKRDQLGCLSGLAAAALLPDPLLLCCITIVTQLYSIALVRHLAAHIYQADDEGAAPAANLRAQLGRDMQAFKQPVIMRYTFFCMLTRVPIAMVAAMAIYFLHRAQPDLGNPTQLLSTILIVRSVGSVLLLEFMQRKLKGGLSESRLAQWGFALMLLSGVLAVLPLALLPSITVLISILLASYLCGPWQRTYRQKLLRHYAPHCSQAGVTGLMISVEASSYIVGAGLVALCGNDMTVALASGATLAMAGTIGVFSEGQLWPLRRLAPAAARNPE